MNHINKVLVANRGEIAVRIFKTLHQMGISTVAVYTEADAASMHVSAADERYLLAGNGLADTYLNIQQLINIARQCEADAIHPGYGFLSEDPSLARLTQEAGLLFIGPTEEAIRLMGNKREARALASKLGVPVIEGATGDIPSLTKKANHIGYPIMVKAAAGGGGKGMRVAGSPAELQEALESTQREAKKYFGNDEVYIEKYLPAPRHIEVQLLADHHGNVITLFERECSLQRRHQKIIEEAPAPVLSVSLRSELMRAANILAREIGYRNAGTVEFLVQDSDFYFLEMNTRIQVEHPVTEMVTGIDIVKEQVQITMGKPIPFSQEDIKIHGHAIEARIYAEDPARGFLPSPGKVLLHKTPEGKGLRVDTALDNQGEISSLFDPMVSKVISYASDRETARKKLQHHLKNYVLLGVKTNISFLIDLINSEDFVAGNIDTGTAAGFLQLNLQEGVNTIDRNLLAMAFIFANPMNDHQAKSAWQQIGVWRLLPTTNLLINNILLQQRYLYHSADQMSIMKPDKEVSYRLLERSPHSMRIDVGGNIHTLFYHSINGEVVFQHEGFTATVSPAHHLGKGTLREINKNPVLEGDSLIKAPMHGTVIKINVKPGDKVNKGDTLLVLESMKMENKISATAKAYVKQINVNHGDMVEDDSLLIHLTDRLI